MTLLITWEVIWVMMMAKADTSMQDSATAVTIRMDIAVTKKTDPAGRSGRHAKAATVVATKDPTRNVQRSPNLGIMYPLTRVGATMTWVSGKMLKTIPIWVIDSPFSVACLVTRVVDQMLGVRLLSLPPAGRWGLEVRTRYQCKGMTSKEMRWGHTSGHLTEGSCCHLFQTLHPSCCIGSMLILLMWVIIRSLAI